MIELHPSIEVPDIFSQSPESIISSGQLSLIFPASIISGVHSWSSGLLLLSSIFFVTAAAATTAPVRRQQLSFTRFLFSYYLPVKYHAIAKTTIISSNCSFIFPLRSIRLGSYPFSVIPSVLHFLFPFHFFQFLFLGRNSPLYHILISLQ